MENQLTYQNVLELIREQSVIFNQNLENSRKEFNSELKESRKEFDKKLGELTGTWGKFVAELVKPKIVELFKKKGIQIETAAQNIEGFIGNDRHYEIDLLLVNTKFAVAVEVKSTLTKEDIDEHIQRLDKIKQISPKVINLSGVTLYGAVAGMIVEQGADRYAYKKGLFVLRQKGNIVEIVNDDKFIPQEWKVEY
jgi:flagellar motor switch protein FliG